MMGNVVIDKLVDDVDSPLLICLLDEEVDTMRVELMEIHEGVCALCIAEEFADGCFLSSLLVDNSSIKTVEVVDSDGNC